MLWYYILQCYDTIFYTIIILYFIQGDDTSTYTHDTSFYTRMILYNSTIFQYYIFVMSSIWVAFSEALMIRNDQDVRVHKCLAICAKHSTPNK